MNRLTYQTDRGFEVSDIDKAIERLAKYEEIHEAMEREQEELSINLARMREEGKEKTLKYREAFTKKLQNIYPLSLFQSKGL